MSLTFFGYVIYDNLVLQPQWLAEIHREYEAEMTQLDLNYCSAAYDRVTCDKIYKLGV